MDLDKIRQEIDNIDGQLLDLFLKRMELCESVAAEKLKTGLPVFQESREAQVLAQVAENTPEKSRNASRLLFQTVMDISKCRQRELTVKPCIEETALAVPPKSGHVTVVCPGTRGSNTELAANRLFSDKEIIYRTDFSDVFEAVQSGEADYGVVPIENNTAGEVAQTYRLLAQYDMYICKSTEIGVHHCLAARKGADVKTVYSHEQALSQCSEYLRQHGLKTQKSPNTSIAAQMVSQSDDMSLGVICSAECAQLYGLCVLDSEIGDTKDNMTRFICIGRQPEISEKSDIISISLSIPNTPGSLYSLLTRFALYGLNLFRIESAPVPSQYRDIKTDNFDVIFYIDFCGNIGSYGITCLLSTLKAEMKYFRFLGNYTSTQD